MKHFTSDFHLSHTGVIKFSDRPFKDIIEMDDLIIKNVISPLKEGDDLYFLGDLSWTQDASFKFFNQIPYNVHFHWILGNHEKGWERFKKYCTTIDKMQETVINGNTVIMCHYPMITWNKSHYNSWQLFGHHHAKSNGCEKIDKLASGKQLNVNIEFHDYRPWTEQEVEEYMSHRPDNWDLIRR